MKAPISLRVWVRDVNEIPEVVFLNDNYVHWVERSLEIDGTSYTGRLLLKFKDHESMVDLLQEFNHDGSELFEFLMDTNEWEQIIWNEKWI